MGATVFETKFESIRGDGVAAATEFPDFSTALGEALKADAGAVDRTLSFFWVHQNYYVDASLLQTMRQQTSNPLLDALIPLSILQRSIANKMASLANDADGLTAPEFNTIYHTGFDELGRGGLSGLSALYGSDFICGALNLFLSEAVANHWKIDSETRAYFQKLIRPGTDGIEAGLITALLQGYESANPLATASPAAPAPMPAPVPTPMPAAPPAAAIAPTPAPPAPSPAPAPVSAPSAAPMASASPDADGDGVADDHDKCPHVFGRTKDGCVKKPKADPNPVVRTAPPPPTPSPPAQSVVPKPPTPRKKLGDN